jgi:hypothetical protein
MTTHPYSEDHRVEQPAIQLFALHAGHTMAAQMRIFLQRSFMEECPCLTLSPCRPATPSGWTS